MDTQKINTIVAIICSILTAMLTFIKIIQALKKKKETVNNLIDQSKHITHNIDNSHSETNNFTSYNYGSNRTSNSSSSDSTIPQIIGSIMIFVVTLVVYSQLKTSIMTITATIIILNLLVEVTSVNINPNDRSPRVTALILYCLFVIFSFIFTSKNLWAPQEFSNFWLELSSDNDGKWNLIRDNWELSIYVFIQASTNVLVVSPSLSSLIKHIKAVIRKEQYTPMSIKQYYWAIMVPAILIMIIALYNTGYLSQFYMFLTNQLESFIKRL